MSIKVTLKQDSHYVNLALRNNKNFYRVSTFTNDKLLRILLRKFNYYQNNERKSNFR